MVRSLQNHRYFYRERQSVSELCNQAKEDLVEEAGRGTCDKGTETGVYGIEGLCRAQGVRHQRLQQGLQRGGRVGCQPERSSPIYLPINGLGGQGLIFVLGDFY